MITHNICSFPLPPWRNKNASQYGINHLNNYYNDAIPKAAQLKIQNKRFFEASGLHNERSSFEYEFSCLTKQNNENYLQAPPLPPLANVPMQYLSSVKNTNVDNVETLKNDQAQTMPGINSTNNSKYGNNSGIWQYSVPHHSVTSHSLADNMVNLNNAMHSKPPPPPSGDNDYMPRENAYIHLINKEHNAYSMQNNSTMWEQVKKLSQVDGEGTNILLCNSNIWCAATANKSLTPSNQTHVTNIHCIDNTQNAKGSGKPCLSVLGALNGKIEPTDNLIVRPGRKKRKALNASSATKLGNITNLNSVVHSGRLNSIEVFRKNKLPKLGPSSNAKSKRICYECRQRGHQAKECRNTNYNHKVN